MGEECSIQVGAIFRSEALMRLIQTDGPLMSSFFIFAIHILFSSISAQLVLKITQ